MSWQQKGRVKNEDEAQSVDPPVEQLVVAADNIRKCTMPIESGVGFCFVEVMSVWKSGKEGNSHASSTIKARASLDKAVNLVQQIQTLSGYRVDEVDLGHKDQVQIDSVPKQAEADDSQSSNEKVIPWTISNKYYSAQVHFLARTVKGLAPFYLKGVPAVIFVWKKGHAYKHNIERICRDRDLNGSEPEVSLAIRFESKEDEDDKGRPEEEEEEFEDSAEIDEFLSSRGFEFIDIPTESGKEEEEDALADAIPSLPRVLDALSTIMWPSMQSSVKRQKRPNRTAMDNDTSLEWAQNSFDHSEDTDFDIEDEASLVTAQTPANRIASQARMRKEMEELRRWLEEDEHDPKLKGDNNQDDKDDPWRHASSSSSAPTQAGLMTNSPISEKGGLSALSHPVPSIERDGFDDDFTVFVSAPAEDSALTAVPAVAARSKSHSKSLGSGNDFSDGGFPSFASFGDSEFLASSSSHAEFDDEHAGNTSFDSLAPPGRYSGVMYHSLGSMSDLGDPHDDEEPHLNDEESKGSDGDLPSQGEIRASAERIFGPLPPSPSSSFAALGGHRANPEDDDLGDFDDDDIDFDLTHMVSAIQGMKEEISGIENEEERRKAAARVALGLVYGLDRQR
ncbi:hypothetical protein GYMLUDRAFT_247230 [Collybiopsis luxurians FD-317 M1]|uniref:Unplaced genomic scaffold GYMLUscaffold_44, whole genome shotgun sequence n=1 Tax=Collybiopsis luxurians FD-317 M1 TaxID=944289 RepID=A0A0D0CGG6_9AGAR|nr:hypothetical protein GYMLUDRAFT_247230 [Collybiopsis luxurians FD-317 M1]